MPMQRFCAGFRREIADAPNRGGTEGPDAYSSVQSLFLRQADSYEPMVEVAQKAIVNGRDLK
jgi:hypothetical protein